MAIYIRTNSFLAIATQCKVSRMTVKRIVHKYRQQVSLKAGVGGNDHVTAMKDYVQVYIKFMLMINPELYLSEIRDNLARDLRLNGPDLPSLVTIHRFITQEGLTRKKCRRVAIERFTPENLMKRKAFIAWRKTVDSEIYFWSTKLGLKILLVPMVDHLQITPFPHLHRKSSLQRHRSLVLLVFTVLSKPFRLMPITRQQFLSMPSSILSSRFYQIIATWLWTTLQYIMMINWRKFLPRRTLRW